MKADRALLAASLVLLACALLLAGFRGLLPSQVEHVDIGPERIVRLPPEREDPRPMLHTILDRPLFSAERRRFNPPVETRDEVPPPPPPGALPQLVGVVVTPDLREGLFMLGQRRPERKRTGERVQDWRIEEITPTAVTVTRDGVRQVLTLTRTARPAARKFSF